MTATDVRIALRNRYNDHRRYAVAEEVGLTTGFSHRRLDMMVLDCYSSNGFRIDGFEIKVSTADLRRELEDPEKHIAFFDIIDYYTLAAPAGVVDPLMDIIPKKWGILIVNEDGSTRQKRRALALEDRKADRAVPRGFFASIVRSIQQRQPSTEELKKEYDRGHEDGKAEAERHRAYMSARVEREAEKLEKYDALERRFELWGRYKDVEEVLAEFEAFRKMDTKQIQWATETAIASLNTVLKYLNGQGEPKEDADHGGAADQSTGG